MVGGGCEMGEKEPRLTPNRAWRFSNFYSISGSTTGIISRLGPKLRARHPASSGQYFFLPSFPPFPCFRGEGLRDQWGLPLVLCTTITTTTVKTKRVSQSTTLSLWSRTNQRGEHPHTNKPNVVTVDALRLQLPGGSGWPLMFVKRSRAITHRRMCNSHAS